MAARSILDTRESKIAHMARRQPGASNRFKTRYSAEQCTVSRLNSEKRNKKKPSVPSRTTPRLLLAVRLMYKFRERAKGTCTARSRRARRAFHRYSVPTFLPDRSAAATILAGRSA